MRQLVPNSYKRKHADSLTMKSFIRKKKIKGHEYLYEITPYYDPDTVNGGRKRNTGKKI